MAPGARYAPRADATLEEWRSNMAGAGVTHGVLVQVSFLGHDNTQLLEALDAGGGRLRGVVQCAPDVPEPMLDAWHRRGVRGVRLNTFGMTTRPDVASADWRGHFSRLADRGWHVELHDEGEGLAAMLAALRGCPATLVVAHFGYPGAPAGYAAMLRLADRQDVRVKLSAPYRIGPADAGMHARELVARLGPQRLLWGSDWPHTRHDGQDYASLRRSIAEWVPDPALHRTILWDSPAALYGF